MAELTELGRSDAQGFEICLRRREDEDGVVHELVVNGAFAMDSREHRSEDALAACVPTTAHRVLVAGLGLGFTTAHLLERCPDATVEVVELSGDLVDWAHAGLTPELARVASHPRVLLTVADVTDLLTDPSSDVVSPTWDALLLDVDNGPDFLIHEHNDALYRPDALARAADRVGPGGLVAIWCQQRSDDLAAVLGSLPGEHDSMVVPVQRGRHRLDYAIHRWWPHGRSSDETPAQA